MAINNDTYLDAILRQGGDAVEAVIPSPLLNGVNDTLAAFYTDPLHAQPSQGAWDTFSDLFGRWATRIAMHTYQWNSPFEEFVETLANGKGQELIAMETPKMRTFDAHHSDWLVRDYGKPHTKFIPMNFEPRKTISINDTTIRIAILEPGQLAEFTNMQVDTLVNADKIATYTYMKKVLGDAVLNSNFKTVNVPIANPDAPTADELKELSRQIRLFAQLFTVAPSALYSIEGVTTVTGSGSDLVLFTTPKILASLDVNVLANAFNVSYAEIKQRVIVLDELPYKDVWAILADKRLLREFRQVRTIAGMPYDPSTQSFNLSLVHRSAIGFNPFVNAVAFSAQPTTVRDVVKVTRPTGLTVKVVSEAGHELESWNPRGEIQARLVVLPVGEAYDPEKFADAAKVKVGYSAEITAETGEGDPLVLNSRTFVDEFGWVHTQKTLPVGTVLTFNVKSFTNLDPSGSVVDEAKKEPLTGSVSLTVGDDTTARADGEGE